MRVAFYTLGCKVNQYETQLLKEHFKELSYEECSPREKADIYIVNSCTVTSHSNKKARQFIHKIKRDNPDSIVALIGCFPQVFTEEAMLIEEADIICGTKNKNQISDLIEEFKLTGKRIVKVMPHKKGETFEKQKTSAHEDKTRAFLKIEDGCERFCSYCIIPMARGPVRSKEIEDIIKETEVLVKNGYKEIVLVGINLAMYGYDKGLRLIDAVKAVCGVKGVERVRLGSSEPMLVTAEDFKEMSKYKNLCPHFHVALQAGCDKTLKSMNRIYNKEEYREIIDTIRENFENPAITTDIIVGFPGETDEDFEETLDFAKEMNFAQVHVFPYSRREGTKADFMPNQVEEYIKTQRSKTLIEECGVMRNNFLNSQVGKIMPVLFENTVNENGRMGHTMNYTPIFVNSSEAKQGQIQNVLVTKAFDEFCIGELI